MLELKESRRGTDSIKWDDAEALFGYKDLLPMWVADMDFAVSESIQAALQRRVQHPNYGYTCQSKAYTDAVLHWMKTRHQLTLTPESVVFTPGVVTALSLLLQAMTEEGDSVLIQTPVYPPFYESVTKNNRVLVTSSLVRRDGQFEMDFDDVARKLKMPEVKAMIFCHPHNPIGRVWQPEEVQRLVQLCHENDVYLISDEIHLDLTFERKHYSVLRMDQKYHEKLVACTAPSKTFNIAGLHMSNILIPNEALRARYKAQIERFDVGGMNPLGQAAVIAAYTESDAWYEEMMMSIENNFKYIKERLAGSKYRVDDIQGTYLCLIDFSALETDHEKFKKRLLQEAKVAVNMGERFGTEIKTSFRLNFGCSKEQLSICLDRLLAMQ